MSATPAPGPASPDRSDLSERADGPALFALLGDDAPDNPFRLGTREYDWHSHLRGQIFCIESGLAQVRTERGAWLLPPHRAAWMPPGLPHQVSLSAASSGWSVLVAPAASTGLPEQPCVMGISEVMRALVRRAVQWAGQEALQAEQDRLLAVLLDEMRAAPHEPLHLPMPSDRRLLRIAKALLAQPQDDRGLEAWAAWAGLSARSLSRLFLAETALSFARWRQQARLCQALERLLQGEAVADVAEAMGYATPSNFIAMFRRSFGESPARYVAQRRASGA